MRDFDIISKGEYKEFHSKKMNRDIDSIRSGDEYAKRVVLSNSETQDIISDAISAGEPYWIGRFGGTEMKTMNFFSRYPYPILRRHKFRVVREDIDRDSGFFAERRSDYARFAKLMIDCSSKVDMLGIWNWDLEEWYLEKNMPQTQVTHAHFLEPWYGRLVGDETINPWTRALAGKKVLLVHPFANSIRTQYLNNQENIFANLGSADEFLPQFELLTVEAYQSLGKNRTGFSSWFDALDSMADKCSKYDFDVAIVGCGAYGFPLSAKLKEMGKVVIHLGGATQLLFGIKGKRWENDEIYGKMINSFWISPSKEETPDTFNKVEGGCYW